MTRTRSIKLLLLRAFRAFNVEKLAKRQTVSLPGYMQHLVPPPASGSPIPAEQPSVSEVINNGGVKTC